MYHHYQLTKCRTHSTFEFNNKRMVLAACGQLGQSYQDYHCSPEEQHMECDVDPQMSITGVTHAKVKCSNTISWIQTNTVARWINSNRVSQRIYFLLPLSSGMGHPGQCFVAPRQMISHTVASGTTITNVSVYYLLIAFWRIRACSHDKYGWL